jgi:hypothetical protein
MDTVVKPDFDETEKACFLTGFHAAFKDMKIGSQKQGLKGM